MMHLQLTQSDKKITKILNTSIADLQFIFFFHHTVRQLFVMSHRGTDLSLFHPRFKSLRVADSFLHSTP